MKKLFGLSFLLTLLFAIPVFAGVPVDKENFPDQAFREIITQLKDYSAEYNVIVPFDVAEIDCKENQSVKDLTGIHNFENLTSLSCNKCPVEKLDLSGNPKLDYLDVCETKLTSLDVTHNPELKQLWAYGNSFTTLDLSKCPYLSKAVKNGVYNNNKNGGASYSFADDATNSYVVVDKKVKIKLADGTTVGPAKDAPAEGTSSGSGSSSSGSSSGSSSDGTSLVIVAAINGTNFPDTNFRNYVKTLDKDNDNQLSREEIDETYGIDCSGRNIASLKGIRYFTEATSLNCSSNKLTALDVSKNTKLRSLNCSGNKLKSLDISKNTLLNYLNCRSNDIRQIDVSNAGSLRAAVLKGRNTESSGYDYFKDPHYMTFTTYIHGMPGGSTTIDNSYYLYVDKTVTVKALGVTIAPSVTPPASTSSGKSSTGSSSSSKSGSSSGSTSSSSKGSTPSGSGSVNAGGGNYKISNGAAVFTGVSSAGQTKVTIPETISDGSKTYKVTTISANACKDLKKVKTIVIGKNVKKISKNAFAGCKATKLVLKTTHLKKKTVKGCLKGSKIKTVQIKIGKKKVNKKYVKKYKKIFKKKIVGRKVKVK